MPSESQPRESRPRSAASRLVSSRLTLTLNSSVSPFSYAVPFSPLHPSTLLAQSDCKVEEDGIREAVLCELHPDEGESGLVFGPSSRRALLLTGPIMDRRT